MPRAGFEPRDPSNHWDRHMDIYKMQLQHFPRAAADSSGPAMDHKHHATDDAYAPMQNGVHTDVQRILWNRN
jgi:hypothetical protein